MKKIILILILIFVSLSFAQSNMLLLMGDDALKYELIPNLTIDFNPLAANVVKNANNKVIILNDISGFNHRFSQSDTSKSPMWVDNYVNGQPALLFDGSNDIIAKDYVASALAQPSVYFLVINKTTDATLTRTLMDGSTRNLIQLLATSGYVRLNAGASLDATSNAPSGWTVVTAVFNNTSSAIYINGISVKTGTVGTTGLDGWYIGGVTNGFGGYLARFLMYSRALTPAEILAISTQLKKDYGIN